MIGDVCTPSAVCAIIQCTFAHPAFICTEPNHSCCTQGRLRVHTKGKQAKPLRSTKHHPPSVYATKASRLVWKSTNACVDVNSELRSASGGAGKAVCALQPPYTSSTNRPLSMTVALYSEVTRSACTDTNNTQGFHKQRGKTVCTCTHTHTHTHTHTYQLSGTTGGHVGQHIDFARQAVELVGTRRNGAPRPGAILRHGQRPAVNTEQQRTQPA